jgi:hypothetical protein
MRELVPVLHVCAPTLTRLVDGAVDAALAYRLPTPRTAARASCTSRIARLESLMQADASMNTSWWIRASSRMFSSPVTGVRPNSYPRCRAASARRESYCRKATR